MGNGKQQRSKTLAAMGWGALALLAIAGAIVPMIIGAPVLAVFPALLLLGLAALAFVPKWLVYGVVFLFPLGSVRHLPEPLGSVQLHWLLAAGLLVAFAGYVLINPRLTASLRANIWAPYALFLVVALFAAVLSPYRSEALSEAMLVVIGMVFVALMIVFLDGEAVRIAIPRVIVAAISLGSVVALVEYHLGIYVVGSPETTGYRAEGLTGDPNGFAMNLLFVLPFLAYQLSSAPDLARKLLVSALILINLAAMVATFSRSGALMLLLLVPVLFLANAVRIRPRALGFVFLLGVLMIAAIAATVPREFWERQSTLVAAEKDNSLGRRSAYVFVAARAFSDSPVLGHGLGSFKYIFSKTPEAAQFDKGDVHDRFRDAHNTYLEVLVGTGLVGLVIFIALVFSAIKNYIRSYRLLTRKGHRQDARLVLHYLIAFVTLLAYLVFFSDVHQKFVLLMLAASVVWLQEAEGPVDGAARAGLHKVSALGRRPRSPDLV